MVLGFKVVWVTEVAMDDVAENSDASCLEGREADLGDPCHAGSRPNTARAWVNEPSVAKSIEDRSLERARNAEAAPDCSTRPCPPLFVAPRAPPLPSPL